MYKAEKVSGKLFQRSRTWCIFFFFYTTLFSFLPFNLVKIIAKHSHFKYAISLGSIIFYHCWFYLHIYYSVYQNPSDAALVTFPSSPISFKAFCLSALKLGTSLICEVLNISSPCLHICSLFSSLSDLFIWFCWPAFFCACLYSNRATLTRPFSFTLQTLFL